MNKLMVKLLVGSEAVFFLCLIVAYLYLWRGGGFATQSEQQLHTGNALLFSIALFASSLTLIIAERKARKRKPAQSNIWLAITVLLGFIFLTGQGKEYYDLIHNQFTIDKGEFASVFFTLTGFHVLHVIMGLIALAIILCLGISGSIKKTSGEVLSSAAIYWHFVDIVWVILFTLIYLSPYLL